MTEFIIDGSVDRILVLAGVILILFMVYFLMVHLSNRSLKKINQRTSPSPSSKPPTQAWWRILILIVLMGGLLGILSYLPRVSL